jgi:1-acyl-sn-glycerol-3-phosphate acyltransferase
VNKALQTERARATEAIAIIGSHRTMPRGAKFPGRGRVVVRIGEPLAVPKVEGRLTRGLIAEWTRRFHDSLADLLPPDQRPLAEPARPAPSPLQG